MCRDGRVEVQRFRYGTIGHRCCCRSRTVCSTIPAYILIGLLGARHLGVAVVHAGKQRLVGTLVVIVVAVEAQAGVQRLNLLEVDNPFQTIAVEW